MRNKLVLIGNGMVGLNNIKAALEQKEVRWAFVARFGHTLRDVEDKVYKAS